jgi:hypothetical protein
MPGAPEGPMAVSRGAVSGPIERASAADLVMLAMDGNGRLPEQLGAVLVFGPGPRPDAVAMGRELADRARQVVRLRQRLVRVPPGCGRRIWVDDPSARPEDHVRLVSSPAPGDERVLLDLAAEIVAEPLPPCGRRGRLRSSLTSRAEPRRWSSSCTTCSPTGSRACRS